jgi:hypothetical protein
MMGLLHWIWSVVYSVCPNCKGEGWFVDYFGEGTGCRLCNPDEDREEPITRVWFWKIWRQRYRDWQMDRWVDQQVAKDKDK